MLCVNTGSNPVLATTCNRCLESFIFDLFFIIKILNFLIIFNYYNKNIFKF
jgi:hypothetical protein